MILYSFKGNEFLNANLSVYFNNMFHICCQMAHIVDYPQYIREDPSLRTFIRAVSDKLTLAFSGDIHVTKFVVAPPRWSVNVWPGHHKFPKTPTSTAGGLLASWFIIFGRLELKILTIKHVISNNTQWYRLYISNRYITD